MVGQQQTPNETENDRDRIFSDPTLQQTMAEDPLLKYFKENWRQTLIILGTACALYFGYQTMHETYVQSMQRAGEIYSNLHKQLLVLDTEKSDLSKAVSEQDEKNRDAKASDQDKQAALKKVSDAQTELNKSQDKLKEMLTALSDSREPYKSIAQIYRGIFALRNGDLAGAKDALSAAAAWKTQKADTKERFYAESAAFTLAGALLDQDNGLQEAKGLLRDLAGEGGYLSVPAALRLARIAVSPEEKSEAISILESLKAKQPTQNTLLDAELSHLR